MIYIIKFLFKLLFIMFLYIGICIKTFFQLILFFNWNNTNDFDWLNEIYYRNSLDKNFQEETGKRKLAKDKNIFDWLLDNKNQYSFFSVSDDWITEG